MPRPCRGSHSRWRRGLLDGGHLLCQGSDLTPIGKTSTETFEENEDEEDEDEDSESDHEEEEDEDVDMANNFDQEDHNNQN